MSNVFNFKVSIFVCKNCDAPIEIPMSGGTTECKYCGTKNKTAIPHREPFKHPEGLSKQNDSKRLAVLQKQISNQESTPDDLGEYVKHDTLLTWKLPEVVLLWKDSRKKLETGADEKLEERFSYLTVVLGEYFVNGGKHLNARGLYESALETLKISKYRQPILGWLCKTAALEGEIENAKQWLKMCEPDAIDLKTDSIFRFSKAVIEVMEQNWQEVLSVLGEDLNAIPFWNSFEANAVAIRATAFEQLGKEKTAVEMLHEYMSEGGLRKYQLKQAINEFNNKITLCNSSFGQAKRHRSQDCLNQIMPPQGGAKNEIVYSLGILLLTIGILSGIYNQIFHGNVFYILDGVLGGGILGILLTTLGYFLVASDKKIKRIYMEGIETTAKIITRLETARDGEKRVIKSFDVEIESSNNSKYTVNLSYRMAVVGQGIKLNIGQTVPIKIDPKDPKHIIFDS